jgi:RING-type zinc-finger
LEDEEADSTEGKRHDCAICMQSIEYPTLPVSGGGSDTVALSANVLGRKVARTPCGHVFHTTCLEEVSPSLVTV